MEGINVLSVFDGMSCGQIALNELGVNVNNYFASEIDEKAIIVTMANYPKTIQLGDVTEVKGNKLPQIHLLIGGSPCQGFSLAGKQLNFDDSRSKLFFEFVRLKNELQPIYFLLENVGMKKSYVDVISDYLGVQPIEINSSKVSGSLRKRLYWTNIPNVTQPNDEGIKLSDVIESGFVDVDKAYCIDASYYKGGNLIQYFQKRRRQIVFDIVNYTKVGNYNDKHYSYRMLTVNECEALQGVPKDYTNHVAKMHRYHMLGNGWTIPVIKHIFKNLQF